MTKHGDEQDPGALDEAGSGARLNRYSRDSLEFGRLVNLCDAVFAIALTLLVLTLDSWDLAGLIGFGLAFLLIGNVWYHHHRIVAQLAWAEPGLIVVNLALLAGVALAPFPTGLVGADPGAPDAVLPFIGLFIVLSSLTIVFILRAHKLRAWRRPLSPRLFRWVLADWLAHLGVLVASFLLALAAPVASLVLLAAASTVTALTVSRLGPPERRAWF